MYKDITGQKFGRLVALYPAQPLKQTKHRSKHWMCQCECGTKLISRRDKLITGNTQSCGCLLYERQLKHGLSRHKLQPIINHIHQRCLNPNSKQYKDYGARGITICPEWKHNYTNFFRWALEHGYRPGLQIDRIDNNGPYSPTNCRFVDAKTNMRNRRNSKIVRHEGKQYVLAEFLEKFAVVAFGSIRVRMQRWKCDIKTAALTTPQKGIKYNG